MHSSEDVWNEILVSSPHYGATKYCEFDGKATGFWFDPLPTASDLGH
ncbi:MAG TPA: hypothetical protein VFM77_18550 [Terriglobales bacterium]|nr:hypothetical protein [Terriglobales bacterium]